MTSATQPARALAASWSESATVERLAPPLHTPENETFWSLNRGQQLAARRHFVRGGPTIDTYAGWYGLGTDCDAAWRHWLVKANIRGGGIAGDCLFLPADPLAWEDENMTADDLTPSSLVGPGEIAAALGVQRNTVTKWRMRDLLPEPVALLDIGAPGGALMPVWRWGQVERWAKTRGMLDK